MDLRDRYYLRQLIAVGVQLFVLLWVFVYGLWSPSLGAKVFWPTVAMLPIWGVAAWLTLHRPWDWGGLEGRKPLHRMWGYWEPGVVYGGTYGLGRLHGGMLSGAKAYDAEMSRPLGMDDAMDWMLRRDEVAAWNDDTLGMLIISDLSGWISLGGCAFVLALMWFLLPR